MTTVFEPTGSCMSSSMACTLLSVLTSSGSTDLVMSFGWMKTLLRDQCLMRWSVVIGGRDDVRVGETVHPFAIIRIPAKREGLKICTLAYIIQMLVDIILKMFYIGSQSLVAPIDIHRGFEGLGTCNV